MQHLIAYALQFVGKPYIWGGEHPSLGFDCSGLVQAILASAGMDPEGDQTAQGLYDHFEHRSIQGVFGPGALAFYGKSVTQISHVAFCIDAYRCLEAGGGDSKTRTIQDAIDRGAYVRMRLIRSRKDFLVTLKPQYVTIGMI